jgi:hypothetical protein
VHEAERHRRSMGVSIISTVDFKRRYQPGAAASSYCTCRLATQQTTYGCLNWVQNFTSSISKKRSGLHKSLPGPGKPCGRTAQLRPYEATIEAQETHLCEGTPKIEVLVKAEQDFYREKWQKE